jgi:hypothetical protein
MKLQVSPTTDFWISVVLAIFAALATGTVAFPDSVPATAQHNIKQWAAFIVGYYTILAPLFPGFSSALPGPFVNSSNKAPPVGPVAALFIVGALLLAAGGGAHAAPAKHAVRAAPVQRLTIPNLPAKALGDAINDLNATVKLAEAQKDAVAVSCYTEILTELNAVQASQAGSASLPTVHLFYAFQTARGFANAAMPNSPLNNACAPLAQQVKMSVLTLINGLVTGGFGLATIGPLFGLP